MNLQPIRYARSTGRNLGMYSRHLAVNPRVIHAITYSELTATSPTVGAHRIAGLASWCNDRVTSPPLQRHSVGCGSGRKNRPQGGFFIETTVFFVPFRCAGAISRKISLHLQEGYGYNSRTTLPLQHHSVDRGLGRKNRLPGGFFISSFGAPQSKPLENKAFSDFCGTPAISDSTQHNRHAYAPAFLSTRNLGGFFMPARRPGP